jgi:hypothetical protein
MAKRPKPENLERRNRAADHLAAGLAASQPTRREAPTAEALRRWSVVPLLYRPLPPPDRQSGQVVFDAWTSGGVALRDASEGHTRRLILGCGTMLLDLVGWRDARGWQFTARAGSNGQVHHEFILKTGRKRYLPGSDGYFQWRSKSVPRVIELWSEETCIAFEPIAWA